jgi:hypothetical protein
MQPESQGCPGQSVHWRHTRFSFEGITDYRKLERVQMAVTKGHGNPKWMKEETILALDLYLKAGKAIPAAGTSKRVVRTALRSAWVVGGSNPDTIRAETACQGGYKLSLFRKFLPGSTDQPYRRVTIQRAFDTCFSLAGSQGRHRRERRGTSRSAKEAA